jgi:diketogulonate reductase-like aldo/keto reductase
VTAESFLAIRDVRVPRLLYGTAWKEDQTAALTRAALDAGFRGIDTANQRRHYFEAAVGEALRGAFVAGLPRDEVFVQTKFTFRPGQDHRLPYDPSAPVAEQVEQSFASSLDHLGVATLDAYLLHGPSTHAGLAEADWEAWGAMERLQQQGKARLIGVSNVSIGQLQALHAEAAVKPAIVQNRCFTRPAADGDVRAFCAKHGLAYEGFSLLTAIPHILGHPALREIAASVDATPAQVVFRYCLDRGMVVLTGTTSRQHMEQDLRTESLRLGDGALATMDVLTGAGSLRIGPS